MNNGFRVIVLYVDRDEHIGTITPSSYIYYRKRTNCYASNVSLSGLCRVYTQPVVAPYYRKQGTLP
jgi:hypothetical protein